jgi:hypothetical protein
MSERLPKNTSEEETLKNGAVNGHTELLSKLAVMGVKPEDIPNSYSKVSRSLEDFNKRYAQLIAESNPKRKEQLRISLKKLGVAANRACVKALEAAREHLKMHPAETVDTSNLDLDLSGSDPVPTIDLNNLDLDLTASAPGQGNVGKSFEKTMPLPAKDIPFDPHSVPSVDDSHIRADQYTAVRRQEGMDKLNQGAEGATRPASLAEEQLTAAAGMAPTEDVLNAFEAIDKNAVVADDSGYYEMNERQHLLDKIRRAAEKKKQIEEKMAAAKKKQAATAAIQPEAEQSVSSDDDILRPIPKDEIVSEPVEEPKQTEDEKTPRTHEAARKEASYYVGTEVRDDGLKYVSIIPPAFEGTRHEWYTKLKNLIDKFTK